MNELITISNNEVNGQFIKTVNARDLHAFLEVGKDFSNWIKGRIDQYDFVENQDFIMLAKTGEQVAHGGSNRIDYHISLDMAKELSMVERNAKGKEARQYFIQCEKIAKESVVALPNFNDPVAAARAWADAKEGEQLALIKIEQQQKQLEEQAPAVEFLDRYVDANTTKSFREVSKVLNVKEREFISFLIDKNIVFRHTSGILPCATYQHKGYFEVKTGERYGHVFSQTRFTTKGVAWIAKRFSKIQEKESMLCIA